MRPSCLKIKKWKTIEALTRFSLCKPNIIYGRRHNRTYVQFRYKTNTHLTCHHFLDSSVLFVLCVCVCASVRPSIHNKKELNCFVRSTKSKWRSWQYSTNKYSDRGFLKDYFRYAVVKGKSKSLTSRIPTFAQKFNGRRDNFFV